VSREIQWLRKNSLAMTERVGLQEAMCYPEFMPAHLTDEQIRDRLISDLITGFYNYYFKDYGKRIE